MSCLINPYQVSPAAGGDPFFSDVLLLSGFEGADGSTSFTDESSFARTLTANGNAQIDTAQFKYGTSSLLCDGSGDFVSAADNNVWAFPQQFTMEFWLRLNAVGANQGLICQSSGAVTTSAFDFFVRSVNSVRFSFYSGGTTRTITSSTTLTTGTWYHIAVDRDSSNVLRLYIDGAVAASGTFSDTINNSAEALRLGSSQGFNFSLNGWMDEVRITTGHARYSGAFTPPASAFPRS